MKLRDLRIGDVVQALSLHGIPSHPNMLSYSGLVRLGQLGILAKTITNH